MGSNSISSSLAATNIVSTPSGSGSQATQGPYADLTANDTTDFKQFAGRPKINDSSAAKQNWTIAGCIAAVVALGSAAVFHKPITESVKGLFKSKPPAKPPDPVPATGTQEAPKTEKEETNDAVQEPDDTDTSMLDDQSDIDTPEGSEGLPEGAETDPPGPIDNDTDMDPGKSKSKSSPAMRSYKTQIERATTEAENQKVLSQAMRNSKFSRQEFEKLTQDKNLTYDDPNLSQTFDDLLKDNQYDKAHYVRTHSGFSKQAESARTKSQNTLGTHAYNMHTLKQQSDKTRLDLENIRKWDNSGLDNQAFHDFNPDKGDS